jgi:hypothetical protein
MLPRPLQAVLIALLLLALAIPGTTPAPARAAEELTLSLTPALGPNGTVITLIGKGATPSAEAGYLYSEFSSLADCQTNHTSEQAISGGTVRADGDGNFAFKHTVDERAGIGALRFLANTSGGRTSPSACFTIIPAQQTFPQTGKMVRGSFLAYWYSNGGLAQQGLPLTDEFEETNPSNGKTYRVQYFERARFEAHPENAAPYNVLLGLLGTEQFGTKYPQGGPARAGACASGEQEFAQTGHCVGPRFNEYWKANGGLAQQGLPLSEEFAEVNPSDGKTYSVQYFERARFEYHPENAAPYNVLLGLLGGEQYKAKYGGGTPQTSPVPSSKPSPSAAPSPKPSTSPAPSASPSPAATPRTPAQLTISPQVGPNSTLFAVTGAGFVPNNTYYLRVTNVDNGARIVFDDTAVTSSNTGIIATEFSFGTTVPAGTYTASIATAPNGASLVATVNFTINGPDGAKPGPNLVVTPPQGQPGARMIVTGTGLAPKTAYDVRIRPENGTAAIVSAAALSTDEDGILYFPFNPPLATSAGAYIAELLRQRSDTQVVVALRFTIVAAP